MNIEEMNKHLNSNPYTNYLVRDKDIIRTPYTSEINFKNTSPICNLEEIDCSTSGVLEDIEDTIFKLNDIDYDALSFSFCGGLVVKNNKHKTENIDDLFLYRLIIYPVKSVNGEYRRISGSNKNIYRSVSGSMEKIIHFDDLLAILNSLHILPLYVDSDYFKVLTEGFLGCGKPILFTLKKQKTKWQDLPFLFQRNMEKQLKEIRQKELQEVFFISI